MSKRRFFLTVAGVLLVFNALTGCVSTNINYTKVRLDKQEYPEPGILNLQNRTKNAEYFRQVENGLGKILSTSTGEEYGYYLLDLQYDVMAHPSTFPLNLINGWTIFVLSFTGIPTDSRKFTLAASLRIFNSNGDLVRSFKETETFVQVAGLYYGHDPSRKADRLWSHLIEELMKTAASQREEINRELRVAGPILDGNILAARRNLDWF
ncbi:MAG: hypothetical protein LBF78_09040 [Treponema sp.]|jgi:hypothetical protein|nr:hypothetical protein [Treponema sp.]